jgi:endonuclease YncB( thermonuclease family)
MLKKALPAIILFALCIACIGAAVAQEPKPIAIDGDTIAVGAERIRIIGIDTPETYAPTCDREEAAGYLAAGRLQHLMNMRKVRVVRQGRDKYARTLAHVFVGQDNVADTLIAEGVAVPYDGRSKRTYWIATLCGTQKGAAGREESYLQ